MCGLVALVGDLREAEPLRPMLAAVRSRGPDDEGVARSRWFALGFHRLAIVALEAGQQPVCTDTGDIHLAFNGEIYNFRALQKRLLDTTGWYAASEAQALLRCYELRGPSFVSDLDGDYAIVIADSRTRTWYAFRDARGVKPLYYASLDGGRCWAFASHVASLFAHPRFTAAADLVTLAEHRVLGFWAADRTCFDSISQVPPGSVLELRVDRRSDLPAGGPRVSRIEGTARHASADQHEEEDNIAERCTAGIRRALAKRVEHCESGPVAIALSGGIDSSLLAVLAAKHLAGRTVAITLQDDSESDDGAYATRVAEEFGIPHRVHRLDWRGFAAQYVAAVREHATAGPCYTPFFLGRALRQWQPHSKVMICGEGADEFFLGYPIFTRAESTLTSIRTLLAAIPARVVSASALLTRVARWSELTLAEAWLDHVALFQRDQLVNSHLIPFDHGPMASAIECRVPYLDPEVVRVAESVPPRLHMAGRATKILLRIALAAELSDRPALARALLERRGSAAFMALQRWRLHLRQRLAQRFQAGPAQFSELAPYVRDAEHLLWLAGTMIVFCRYKGDVHGMSLDDLANEVFEAPSRAAAVIGGSS